MTFRSSRCSAGLGSSSNESGIHSNNGSFCDDEDDSQAGALPSQDSDSVFRKPSYLTKTFNNIKKQAKKSTEEALTPSQNKFQNARKVFEKV